MAEITKFQANEVSYHIRHDLRELPYGKSYGNESVNPDLTPNNYKLIDRGNAAEVNSYRKTLEKDVFKYNRKNLVHAVEICIQCPSDCTQEQKTEFFQESYNYVVSTLPMGERCVLVAEVHKDERHFTPDGTMISKDHLHILYTPAVPDTKHDGYEWKLCADQLTKRATLKAFHPGLQKHLDECGIRATVYQKKDGSGKNIALSVKQLKEITKQTGIVFNKSMSVDELAQILVENRDIKIFDSKLKQALSSEIEQTTNLKKQIIDLQDALSRTAYRIQEKDQLQQMIHEKDASISNVEQQNEILRQKIAALEADNSRLSAENRKSSERIQALEQTVEQTKKAAANSQEVSKEWGAATNGWGRTNTWGTYTHETEVKSW